MINRIIPTEFQINKANSSDTEASVLNLSLYMPAGTVSSNLYNKRNNFDFDIVYFPFLDGDISK